jgi:hypothetical protein
MIEKWTRYRKLATDDAYHQPGERCLNQSNGYYLKTTINGKNVIVTTTFGTPDVSEEEKRIQCRLLARQIHTFESSSRCFKKKLNQTEE